MKKTLLLLFILYSFSSAQASTSIVAIRDTVVIPGSEYKADPLYRFFMGDHWRDLWTMPIQVPIIDLHQTAGGLIAFKRGGGFQTKSLHFKGANGKYYKFRSIDKDPKKVLPPYLQETFIAELVQDQISTSHPLSAVIVAPLLTAVGVLHSNPEIVLLPDDENLSEFKEDFKYVLGTFAENPTDETDEAIPFQGADKVKKMYTIFEVCEKSNKNQVDAKEFLKSRLMDVYLGDWDRHIGQWKWARFKENGTNIWKPIPRDRDQAFSMYDGLFPYIAAQSVPQIESFEEDYPQINDITWSGRFLDRRFLVSLDKATWDSITTFIQTNLTDSIIISSVKKMPVEWYKKTGEQLIEKLKIRRENLAQISNDYYELISKYVSIYASDKDEYSEIIRLNDKKVEVAFYNKSKKSEPFFHRIFDSDITSEIRIDMLGGDDSVLVRGKVDESILVRIIGGNGKDTLIDSSSVNGYFLNTTPFPDAETKTIFYDSGKKTTFIAGASTKCITDQEPEIKPYNEEIDNYNEKFEPQTEDRGHDWKPGLVLNYSSDDGLVFGGGPILYEFGFRTKPYVYRMSLFTALATKPESYSVRYSGEFYKLISNVRILLDLSITGLTFTQFYGFGNDTKINESLGEEFYSVNQDFSSIQSSIEIPVDPKFKYWFGYLYSYSQIDLKPNSLLFNQRPKGVKDWSYMGISAGLQYDNRDDEIAPMNGFYLNVCNIHFPGFLDNENAYSRVKFDARTYFQSEFLTKSSLAFRLLGTKIWGNFPFFESAVLGGQDNLRGYRRERFSGDALLNGSLDWRAYLMRYKLIVPAQFGFTLFTDIGRVFYAGENSETWHQSYGGGLWTFFIKPEYLVSASLASSPEDLAVYFSVGFSY